jgi:hypothetical protein
MNDSRRDIIIYECLSLRRNCMVPSRPNPPPPPHTKRKWIPQGPNGGRQLAAVGGGGDPFRTTEQKAWPSVYSVMPVLLCAEVFKCRLC